MRLTARSALYEREMRALLFNPFGHALLKNPSYGASPAAMPGGESGTSVAALIETFAAAGDGCEGLVVTRGGRFEGVIGSKILIRLAAERDAETARSRATRLAQIDRASIEFQREAIELATALSTVAENLSETAERTALCGTIARVSAGHHGVVTAISAIDGMSSAIAVTAREQGQAARAIADNLEDAQAATDAIRGHRRDSRTHHGCGERCGGNAQPFDSAGAAGADAERAGRGIHSGGSTPVTLPPRFARIMWRCDGCDSPRYIP